MNFESNKDHDLAMDDENEMKCYPKRATNQMPYQKIEKEIRLNKQWPPITEVNEVMNNGKLNEMHIFDINKNKNKSSTTPKGINLNDSFINKEEETTTL